MDTVNRNGHSFLVPNNECELMSVDSFKRWEEAIGVYSSIYTKENPHRANEIFQYMDTIANVVSTFI